LSIEYVFRMVFEVFWRHILRHAEPHGKSADLFVCVLVRLFEWDTKYVVPPPLEFSFFVSQSLYGVLISLACFGINEECVLFFVDSSFFRWISFRNSRASKYKRRWYLMFQYP
jgi:hypothetical protein